MNIINEELENAMDLVISTLALFSEQNADRILQDMGDTVRTIKKKELKGKRFYEIYKIINRIIK